MKNINIKYSILIPARNGGKCLPTCVETIISQDFHDYELIISDDHSVDNTPEYLSAIDHPNVKIVYPQESMSMAEHWEWVLSQANGEWVMFVGQDDGLQPYFFELAERLTAYAKQKKIRTIMSERAYFFWPGCEAIFGDFSVSYSGISRLSILNCKVQAFLALLGFQTYFELPEMYSSSLFHRSIIEEVRQKQKGNLFVTHPQDANLAAIACSLDSRYLKSGIPLGWIGTSPKSAGIAVGLPNDSTMQLKEEYLKKITISRLPYYPLAGDFALSSQAVYFWAALLQTPHLRERWINHLLMSKIFKTLMFAGVFVNLFLPETRHKNERMRMFEEIVHLSHCNLILIAIISRMFRVLYEFYQLGKRVNKKIKRLYRPSCFYQTHWSRNPDTSMIQASRYIKQMIAEERMIKKI